MNNDSNTIPNYESTVRSNENLRDKMEGVVNEPNRFRSTEDNKRVDDSDKSAQSLG